MIKVDIIEERTWYKANVEFYNTPPTEEDKQGQFQTFLNDLSSQLCEGHAPFQKSSQTITYNTNSIRKLENYGYVSIKHIFIQKNRNLCLDNRKFIVLLVNSILILNTLIKPFIKYQWGKGDVKLNLSNITWDISNITSTRNNI